MTRTVATRLLRDGRHESQKPIPQTERLTEHSTVLKRLRRHGALICHSGDVSGVDDLVPKGIRSYVVAASPEKDYAFGVLVLGWGGVYAPCDERAVPSLRIGAALLHRALTDRQVPSVGLADSILGSLVDRIVVIDRHGRIVTTSAAPAMALTGPANDPQMSSDPGPSYYDAIRRASASGVEAASIFERILAVARGNSDFHQAALACDADGEEQWCVITATPFQHPGGGAVVAHTLLMPEKVTAAAKRGGERVFRRLVDAVPAPMWVLAPDGVVLYGNARWTDIVSGLSGRAAETPEWTGAFHPADRERARTVLRAALRDRAPFELELRLSVGHGLYQWSACAGAPNEAMDGSVESYVVFCRDITAQRRAESALRETALKLVKAQEAERSHIGRELHDDLGQRAAILAAKLATIARNRRASGALRGELADAQNSVQDLAVALHNLSHQLHPAKLRLLGLVSTLDALCREVSRDKLVHVHFSAVDVGGVPEEIALCVFRIAQEALQNAVKHSAARDVDVSLVGTASRLTLRVNDKGRGFDPLASEALGIGLLTMRERVELIGGQLRIAAAQGQGTTIEAVVPLLEHSPDAT